MNGDEKSGPDEETLDPRERSGSGDRDASWLEAALEILFHPDLSRIGEHAVLGDAASPTIASAAKVGRHAPLFVGAGGRRAPLMDPCLSREQVSVRWLAARARFVIEAAPGARRAIELFDSRGRRLARPPADVPAGSLLALGDRALLRLSLRSPRDPQPATDGMLGTSPALDAMRRQIAAAATIDYPVLVRGPIGSGKELAARALHGATRRSRGPFVAVNCAALTENLAESELFGHARGAFSGAVADHVGVFEAASGGSLLLDEVGELSPVMQAKLLRVLEQGTVRRVGTNAEVPVDVRVIGATHRDLQQRVRAGTFRADLHSRFQGPSIDVPSLEARTSDIPLLFTSFLLRLAEDPRRAGLRRLVRPADVRPAPIPLSFYLRLLTRSYPANVRELERIAASVAAVNTQGGAFVLPDEEGGAPAPAEPPESGANAEELRALLESSGYVQGRVARALGVSRTTIDRRMRELGLPRPRDLDRESIEQALSLAGGDFDRAARLLRVGARGLVLRIGELGLGRTARARTGGER